MMNMIYRLRYRRVLFWLGIFLVGIYVFSGFSSQRQWHTQRDYLYSSEFTYVPEMGQQYDLEGNLTNTLTKTEYVKENLRFFVSEQIDGQTGNYQMYQVNLLLNLMPFVMMILGFLAFFLDQKGQFNRFLFSLPFSRKRIYLEKLRYVVLPILLVVALGIFLYDLILYTIIPAPYLNATIGTLVMGGISHFITLLLAFSFGSFLGVSLGNAISGTFFLLLVAYGLLSTLWTFYSNLMTLLSTQSSVFLEKWLVYYPGNVRATMPALGINLLLSLFLFSLSYFVFKSISMEEEGEFLTVRRARHWYFAVSSLLSVAYLMITTSFWSRLDEYNAIDWVFLLLFFVIPTFVLAGFIYFSSIKESIDMYQKKRYLKKTSL